MSLPFYVSHVEGLAVFFFFSFANVFLPLIMVVVFVVVVVVVVWDFLSYSSLHMT